MKYKPEVARQDSTLELMSVLFLPRDSPSEFFYTPGAAPVLLLGASMLMQSNIACDSDCVSAISSTLHHLHLIFILQPLV